MKSLATKLMNDEAGFIVSAELVLIATVGVLTLVVGWSEVALNINNELEDVGSAFGSVNQSFMSKGSRGHGGRSEGGSFKDNSDFCDNTCDVQPGNSNGEN
ncbi:MAG: branched-chain amino acid aminotransferase [Candidatus Saccharimonas sp.]|nr:branched-chain amino acid aminotransferase [Planctomycetaceae bacterium]